MNHSNFHFLQAYQPLIATLGHDAEKHTYSDPQSAIVKLRCFAELYVGFIYEELNLPSYGASNLFELLNNEAFKGAVEQCVLDKLHLIRMKGNKAAHPGGVSVNDALDLVKEAYFLSAWIYMAYYNGQIQDLPTYLPPEPLSRKDQLLKEDKKRLQQALDLQTADLQKAKVELAAAQEKQQEAHARIDDLNREIDQARLASLKEQGHQAVSHFNFEEEETRHKIRMEDIFAEYQLTEEQSELVKELETFLTNRDSQVFLLKGYAGTGKTFITKGLTEYFQACGRNYILAAPTGKAAKVISRKTGSPASTLHRAIYSFKDIAEYKDSDLPGSETYKYYAKVAVNELSVDTVYIVDEASMISDIYNEAEFFRFGSGFLLKDFLEFVNLDHNDHRKKVIFIGDNAQLPPVGMKTSPALNSQYLKSQYGLNSSSFELTEVVRQKSDCGVMANALVLRKALQANTFNELDIQLNYPDLNHIEHGNLVSSYMKSCSGKINAESIILAHSNADVAGYNKRIREEFFPDVPNITRGDKVLAISNNDTNGFFISNGDFGKVKHVYGDPEKRTVTIRRRSQETGTVEHTPVILEFRNIEVGFKDLEGNSRYFDAKIIESLLYSEDPNLSSDENKALYLDFCIRNRQLRKGSQEFKDALRSDPYFNALRLKFGYAITCHKAQGSEWNHVFVKCKTNQSPLCSEYFRWLYTAITRTAKNLYLMDEPHIRLGSGVKVVASPGMINTGGQQTATDYSSQGVNQAIPSTHTPPPLNSSSTSFGIPEDNKFLSTLLNEVEACLAGSDIKILNIDHNNYHESYVFCQGVTTARINISYNNNQKITNTYITSKKSELSTRLFDLLSPLKGRVLHLTEIKHISFNDSFLDDLHQRISKAMREKGIEVL